MIFFCNKSNKSKSNNRLETIDSSLNYLHERIEEYLDK